MAAARAGRRGGIAALAALIDFHLHPTWDGRLAGLGQLRNSVIAALAFDAGLMLAHCSVALATAMRRWRVDWHGVRGAAASAAVSRPVRARLSRAERSASG